MNHKPSCPKCKHEIAFGMKTCPGCGTTLHWGPAHPAPVPAGSASAASGHPPVSQRVPDAKPAGKPRTITFRGRARRGLYWKATLVSGLLATLLFVASFAVSAVKSQAAMVFWTLADVLLLVFALWALVWNLSVQVRRCHDLGWSGGRIALFWGIGAIPVIGTIAASIFFVFLGFVDGQPWPNEYGPDPKGRNFRAR